MIEIISSWPCLYLLQMAEYRWHHLPQSTTIYLNSPTYTAIHFIIIKLEVKDAFNCRLGLHDRGTIYLYLLQSTL